MKPNDAVLSPSAAIAYELGEISKELQSLLNKLDARDARREAKRQRDLYAFKPWNPAIPTVDACGNAIMFSDGGVDARYTVSHAQPNGAHIRVAMHRLFYAIAPTLTEAQLLGSAYAAWAGLIEPRMDGSVTRGDEFIQVRFSSSSSR